MSVESVNRTSHRSSEMNRNDAAAAASEASHNTINHSQVQFRIKNPFQQDLKFTVTLDKGCSIHQVKEHLFSHYPSHPTLSSQKLIFQGRLLHNDETLQELFTNNIDQDQRVMYLSVREGISANRVDMGSDASSNSNSHSSASSDAINTKEAPSASAPPAASAVTQPTIASTLPTQPSSAYPHAFSHPLLPYVPQHYYSPYAGYYPYSYAQPMSHIPQVNVDTSSTSSDSFGLRNRFAGSSSSSSSGVSSTSAESSSSDAHANALLAYHQALQQYHAMYTAAYQQHVAAAYHQYSPYAAATGAGLHPLMAAQLLSQRGMSPASTVGGLSAASNGVNPSTTSSSTTTAPAGSILAALTAARSSPVSAATSSNSAATTMEAQAEEARAAAIREAVQAFVQHAQQANGAAPAAAAVPGAPAAAAAAAAPAVPPAGGLRNFWRYFDFRLMLKFAVLIVLFSQDGDSQRFILLFIAGFIAYLYQVGAFRRGGPPIRDEANARAVARGDMEEEEEDEEVQAAMRAFQQQERDAQRQREAAGAPAAAAVGAGNNNNAAAAAAGVAPAVPAVPQGFLTSVEKFIVGFFASLVPSWQPQTVPAALPPAQAPAAAAVVPAAAAAAAADAAPAAIPLEPVAQAPVEQEGAVAGEAPAAAPLAPEPAPVVEPIPPLE